MVARDRPSSDSLGSINVYVCKTMDLESCWRGSFKSTVPQRPVALLLPLTVLCIRSTSNDGPKLGSKLSRFLQTRVHFSPASKTMYGTPLWRSEALREGFSKHLLGFTR
jgi:hypothetical protein